MPLAVGEQIGFFPHLISTSFLPTAANAETKLTETRLPKGATGPSSAVTSRGTSTSSRSSAASRQNLHEDDVYDRNDIDQIREKTGQERGRSGGHTAGKRLAPLIDLPPVRRAQKTLKLVSGRRSRGGLLGRN